MEQTEEIFTIWVNWERRIVSFQPADGFAELRYATHEEMFQFAIEKTREGFTIQ